jgi:hypothetical protein
LREDAAEEIEEDIPVRKKNEGDEEEATNTGDAGTKAKRKKPKKKDEEEKAEQDKEEITVVNKDTGDQASRKPRGDDDDDNVSVATDATAATVEMEVPATISGPLRRKIIELKEKYRIDDDDITQLTERVKHVKKDGITGLEFLGVFGRDPDYREMYEARLRRHVDDAQSEGMLARFQDKIKAKLAAPTLVPPAIGVAGSVLGFVVAPPLAVAGAVASAGAGAFFAVRKRAEEKAKKRVTRALADLPANNVAKALANPLYASHRQEQVGATVGIGMSALAGAQGAVPAFAAIPVTASAGVAALGGGTILQTGAKVAETGAKLGVGMGVPIAESKATDHNTEGTQHTRVALEYLGMKSRLPLLEKNPDKFSKEDVMNEILRLEIRRSMGMKNDDEDLLERPKRRDDQGADSTGLRPGGVPLSPDQQKVLDRVREVENENKQNYLTDEESKAYNILKKASKGRKMG